MWDQKKWRIDHIKKGYCQSCFRPPLPGILDCEYHVEKNRDYKKRLKEEVFSHYGGMKCACCGEHEPKFLTIDHINNDGASHRRSIKMRKGCDLYVWLKKNSYPFGFQVLCMNCNFGKQHNGGKCPHVTRICVVSKNS